MQKKALYTFMPYLVLTVIFILSFILILTIHNKWKSTLKEYIPMQNEVTTLRNEITAAHLWFEEALGGDTSIDIDQVMLLFSGDRFSAFSKALPQQLYHHNHDHLLEQLIIIGHKLKDLNAIARQRLHNTDNSGIGSDIDQEFDKVFTTILEHIDQTLAAIDSHIHEETETLNQIFLWMIIIFFLVSMSAIATLFIIQRRTHSIEQVLEEERDRRQQQENLLMQQSKYIAMGEMIENIAHQWRQPLNTVGLIIQKFVLLETKGKLDKETLTSNAEKAKAQIKMMSETIDDFRSFYQPNKQKALFCPSQTTGRTLSLIDASLKHHNITVQNNCNRLQDVMGFENQFSQVILNILKNAQDALIEQSVVNPMITLECEEDGPFVSIIIKDNAGGIPDGALERIFEPYFTTKHQTHGTGIGLYMSKIIIENHMNGRLNAHNSEEGAVFTLSLPNREQ